MKATSIEEVIQALDRIIEETISTQNRLGYFACLYRLVTERVREELAKGPGNSLFEDLARMEKMDVIFANRYLDAYHLHTYSGTPTNSWQVAFTEADDASAIVLQHLLLGMNAHIGLDLGIAAEEVCRDLNIPIESFHQDFNHINTILASLVGEVERELSRIWPPLKFILDILPFRIDRVITSFSMELARDKAWNFATQLSEASAKDPDSVKGMIQTRDQEVAAYGAGIARPPWGLAILLFIVRLGERSSVARNIEYLKGKMQEKSS